MGPNEAGGWPWCAQIMLLECAHLYAIDLMLEDLLRAPENRGFMTRPLDTLALHAKALAEAINHWTDEAARLWAGIPNLIDPRAIGIFDRTGPELGEITKLASRLETFAERATTEAVEFRAALAHLPPPNRRGPGVRRRGAYRQALYHALGSLRDVKPNYNQRDQIIARLESVVFECEIDAATVRKWRERKHRATVPDNLR